MKVCREIESFSSIYIDSSYNAFYTERNFLIESAIQNKLFVHLKNSENKEFLAIYDINDLSKPIVYTSYIDLKIVKVGQKYLGILTNSLSNQEYFIIKT